MTTLAEYAKAWDVDILHILQLAAREGVSRTPQGEEVTALKAAVPGERTLTDDQQNAGDVYVIDSNRS